MNDNDFDFDDDDASGSDLVKQLRKQVKELSKALQEREDEIQQFAAMSREQDLALALEELGVNPKIAAFVPDEIEDLDELSEWLGEYGEVFGIAFTDEPESVLDSGSIEAVEAMAAIEDDGIDPRVGMDLEARIQNASTREELQAILRG